MGSTNKAIAALKATFQTPVYPLLDQVRSALGAKIDQELAHLKVMQQTRQQNAVLQRLRLGHTSQLHQLAFCVEGLAFKGGASESTA